METISIADIGMQMLKPEQVPNEVALTFVKAWVETPTMPIKAGLAAAINAWPRSNQLAENDSASIRGFACIILPLPQEAGDE